VAPTLTAANVSSRKRLVALRIADLAKLREARAKILARHQAALAYRESLENCFRAMLLTQGLWALQAASNAFLLSEDDLERFLEEYGSNIALDQHCELLAAIDKEIHVNSQLGAAVQALIAKISSAAAQHHRPSLSRSEQRWLAYHGDHPPDSIPPETAAG
jgi:hypothetical protein